MSLGKIAIYTRVSSIKQVGKDGDSLGTQKKKCEDLLISYGYDLSDVIYYEDAGISGTTITNRIKFKELLDRIKNQDVTDHNYIEGIACMDLSRISRSTKHTIDTFKLLRDYRIKLYTVDRSFTGGLETQNSKLTMNIFAMFNELFIDQIKEKAYAGMEKSVQAGNYQGGVAPLGYEYNTIENEKGNIKKILVINDNERRTIELIFKLFIEDKKSISGVTKYLNDHGYRTKNNKDFKVVSVCNILKNPIYCGRIFWGKSRTIRTNEDTGVKEKKKISIFDINFRDLPKGKHEAIISEDKFQQTVVRLNQRKQKRNNLQMANKRTGLNTQQYYDDNKRVFSNILRCPGCGGLMTSSLQPGYKRKDGSISTPKVYYKCSNYNSGRAQCDGYYSIQEDRVFQFIREQFYNKLLKGFDFIKYYEEFIRDKKGGELDLLLNTEVNEILNESEQVKKNKQKLEQYLDKVLVEQINITDKTCRKYNLLEEKITKLDKQLHVIEENLREYNNKINDAYEKKERLLAEYDNNKDYTNIDEYYNSLSLLKRRELLEQVFDEITIDTISSARKGPKKYKVKEIVYNEYFTPIALCKTLGVKDFKGFGEYLKTKGINISIMNVHFPDIREYITQVESNDFTYIKPMIHDLDRHIKSEDYIKEYGDDNDFTAQFIMGYMSRYGDCMNDTKFRKEYIKAYNEYKEQI